MRNTPYARYTVGSHDHKIFDLNKTPGLIQGIREIFDPRDVKVSDLAAFTHLAPGEVKTFDGDERVEIVDFGGHHGRGGFVSELKTQQLDLEAGAKLTGPMAWRVVAPDEKPKTEEAGGLSDTEACVMLGVAAASIAGAAYFALAAAVAGVAAIGVLVVACVIGALCTQSRKRNIEKLGSLYVLGPSTRTWAV